MPYQPRDFHDYNAVWAEPVQAGHFVEQGSPRAVGFGVAVRDMFSDAGWTPVEPVRARGWRDNGTGSAVLSSETTFD